MASPPAVIIVVRHGARLDAADLQWHLSSPTPYDPPLTYGGWTQCQALGSRIASLLQTREQLFDAAAVDAAYGYSTGGNAVSRTAKGGRLRRKKHRIIIHSSPFLRCVQTSVAISSGVSQYNGSNGGTKDGKAPPSSRRAGGETSPDGRRLATISDEDFEPAARGSRPANDSTTKIKLRLDAFLGEWLSPDYYETITPPPSSVLMLAGAKAGLLHRGEPIPEEERTPHTPRTGSVSGPSTGLWESPTSTPPDVPGTPSEHAVNEEEFLDSFRRLIPRDRAASHGGDGREPPFLRNSTTGSFNRKTGYVPPSPLYAITPHDKIPPGYVAHARDHCVDVDYHWDSMKPPQNWGDGGKYGEEWSSMHRRFRHGLDGMVSWYRHRVESSYQLHGHLRTLHPPSQEDDDDDTDTVLVLVTHGAGCNALIGALTNQPVLIDVGMASLTMAVRRERPMSPPPSSSAPGRHPTSPSSWESALATEYEVGLTASTDHLRTSVSAGSAANSHDTPGPSTLMSLAPGLIKRSNTLPLRPGQGHSAPPTRHITPAPGKGRSTSVSKLSFVQSPLNPNAAGDVAQPVQKTWMEEHKPKMTQKEVPAAASNKPGPFGLFGANGTGGDKGNDKPAAGLWQAKSASSGAGLWHRPAEIPKSGHGSAVISDQVSQPDTPVTKSHLGSERLAAFASPGAQAADDERLEQWMYDIPRPSTTQNESPKPGTKSVQFAEPEARSKSSPPKPPPSLQGSDDDQDRERPHNAEEDLARWPNENGEGDQARRLFKAPSANLSIRETSMKRRWTMNDERNQEKDNFGDWRHEQWMQ